MYLKIVILFSLMSFVFQYDYGKNNHIERSKSQEDSLVISNDKVYRNDTLIYDLKDNEVKLKFPSIEVKIKKKNFVNVVDFGATPDINTDDDGMALQKAIDHLNTIGGGTIYFPAGTYKYHICGNGKREYDQAGLKIYSNTHFKFEKGAILKKTGNEEFLFSGEDLVKNVIFSNGTFVYTNGRQNRKGEFLFWKSADNGLRLKNVQNIQIENCTFSNIGNDAIVVFGKQSRFIKINKCVFDNIFDNAISVQTGVSYCNISNNVITKLAGDGIVMKGYKSIICNNFISDIKYNTKKIFASGIALGPDNFPTSRVIVTNNIILDVSNHGIINDRSKNSIISSNIIVNCANAGVKLGWDACCSLVCNNTFLYSKYGIRMDSHNCLILNNQFKFYLDKSKVGSMLKTNSYNSWVNNVFVK